MRKLIASLASAALLAACGGGGESSESAIETPIDPGGGQLALPAGRVSTASPVDPACSAGGAGTVYINAEVEPMLARATADASHLVAVWQQDRWSNGGARAIVSAASRDGGSTWARVLHPMSLCGGGLPGGVGDYQRASDPWVDIGADGTVHVMALAISGDDFVPLLALPGADLNNRTDTYLPKITPASAAVMGARAFVSGYHRSALSEANEAAFRAHQTAFTRRVMERRIPDWGVRVGLPAAR